MKVSSIGADFVDCANYQVLENATTFKGLLGEGGFARRGEVERAKENVVQGFYHAIRWLREEAERGVSKPCLSPLHDTNGTLVLFMIEVLTCN
ncbi:hypothetical protein [Undibacterium sp. TJN19]|uniref:hypothetical protein n=1 Tax=Undibacterium sp. TJN19 TaxID=3413055 RepID=UPI003BF1A7A9